MIWPAMGLMGGESATIPAVFLSDRVLLYLVVTVVFLFCLVFAFALSTVAFRFRNRLRERRWSRLESVWRPLLLEITSPHARPEAEAAGRLRVHLLWKHVRRQDIPHFLAYVARLAGRLRGEAKSVLIEIAQPFLDDLARRWKRSAPEGRAEAVRILGALGLPAHSDAVVEALDDASPLVAMVAARALMRSGNARYARAVLHTLHRFETWSAGFLASMLAAAGPEAGAELRSQLANPDNPDWTRAVFADTLGQLRDTQAADVAATVLAREKGRDLRGACLRLLGAVGQTRHLPAVRAVCGSADFVVRTHAVAALGRLGEEADVEPLRVALSDRSPWVALQAAWGLKRLKATDLLARVAASSHPRAELVRQVLSGAAS